MAGAFPGAIGGRLSEPARPAIFERFFVFMADLVKVAVFTGVGFRIVREFRWWNFASNNGVGFLSADVKFNLIERDPLKVELVIVFADRAEESYFQF